MIPKICIAFMVGFILIFGHLLIGLNLEDEGYNSVKLTDGEKMTNHILLLVYLYVTIMNGRVFWIDFKTLYNDKPLNEKRSIKKFNKFYKSMVTALIVINLWVYLRFHHKVNDKDEKDIRIRLLYCPALSLVCHLV